MRAYRAERIFVKGTASQALAEISIKLTPRDGQWARSVPVVRSTSALRHVNIFAFWRRYRGKFSRSSDTGNAAAALEAIQEPWLQLHPQVVVERDKILRALGTQTLAEREQWLNQVGALKDEWIIERKVQLLIDKGEILNAKQLLLSVPFQKVHQTYTRTGMWLQICEKLKEPCDPIPQVLGEDRLARFGAYREFQ